MNNFRGDLADISAKKEALMWSTSAQAALGQACAAYRQQAQAKDSEQVVMASTTALGRLKRPWSHAYWTDRHCLWFTIIITSWYYCLMLLWSIILFIREGDFFLKIKYFNNLFQRRQTLSTWMSWYEWNTMLRAVGGVSTVAIKK